MLWVGLSVQYGDFFATMPGAFAKDLNPALWNSADLSTSWAFQQEVYLYGPAQYLALYPVVYLFDSYAEISRFLWVAYAATIALSLVMIARSVRLLGWDSRSAHAGLFCAAGCFFPLHQAFLQREFEVVVLASTSAATYFVLSSRTAIAGALVGFITWFKFFPLIWLPYLAMRRWWRGVSAFAAMTGVVVVLTVALLGADGLGPVWAVVTTQLEKRTEAASMCPDWQPKFHYSAVRNSTWVDAGWALCSLGDRFPVLPVRWLYFGLLGTLGGLFLAGFIRLERGPPLDDQAERWRRALEIGLLILASTTLVHAHYYYMSLLIVPLGLLLARYLAVQSLVRMTLWMAAYLSLSAFAIPPTLFNAVFGVDFWWLYMRNLAYFPGQLLLFGLVYWEYFTLSSRTGMAARA